MINARWIAGAAWLSLAPFLLQGQLPGMSEARNSGKPEAVKYLYPEQLTVPAGKTHPVDLHFRVAEGLHINSHTPGGEYLIPTDFSIPAGFGVSLDSAKYPAGNEFKPTGAPSMKLNVYTGDFIIHADLTADRGSHLVEAKLRYQACDESACMPPKTITVPIDVVGR